MVKKIHKLSKHRNKAWVVTVDMGYGHQRAAYPFSKIAQGGVITANSYSGIPKSDKFIWQNSRVFYEFVSRFKMVPVIGEKVFDLYDKVQAIPKFYPKRDLSNSNMQLRQMYKLFRDNDWGKHLIAKLAKKPLPLVTTFFATAMMAEFFNYPEDIYCILCDADISRAWVPPEPHKSRIIYLASNKRVEERLKLYGVRPERIILTGFPLPEENVGQGLKILKQDLGKRLIQLDPQKVYISQYKKTLHSQVGRGNLKLNPSRPLTITFAVGGAGAQRELGIDIVKSLKKDIILKKVRINLVAGVNEGVAKYFKQELRHARMSKEIGKGVNILFKSSKDEYFKAFNKALRNSDILWTKPSELCFYCALGMPIIMAPPIGSQEIFNQKWLQLIGAGVDQEDPKYTNEWLMDWLNSGWLAEAAIQGFVEAPKYGTYNVEKVIFHKEKEAKEVKTVLQY
ncbi:MAG: Processive diacylglycerol beta-glucosyltransferase [Parcubacteria group bacterium ADurb.Bin326]|nr:MAG: Processive diacylglycerol beta-glucosyltransferase [Parcubacteria group bacterium ADurb.Bin326]